MENTLVDQTDAKVIGEQTLQDDKGFQQESLPDTFNTDIDIKPHQDKKLSKQAKKNVYPIESAPSGFVMIINNGAFQPESGFNPRKGSDKDVKNLAELFQFLGFKVFAKQNLSKSQILKTIEEFKTLFEKQDVDMCIFCIMSHGSSGNLVDIHGYEMDVEEEIIKKFYNTECPALQGVPKLFLLQYCRGDELDFGIEGSFEVERSFASSLESSPLQTTPKLPNVTDILIANSTVPGYVSNRNIHHGTWFFQCLVSVFKENAHNMDIRDMFDQVAIMLNEKESKDAGRRKQTFEVINRGFYKKMYFKPNENSENNYDEVDSNLNVSGELQKKNEGFKRNLRDPWKCSFD